MVRHLVRLPKCSACEKVVEETVARNNKGVRLGVDEFSRKGLTIPLEPPWYAARVTGAIAHTQGGLGRALDHVRGQALYYGEL